MSKKRQRASLCATTELGGDYANKATIVEDRGGRRRRRGFDMGDTEGIPLRPEPDQYS